MTRASRALLTALLLAIAGAGPALANDEPNAAPGEVLVKLASNDHLAALLVKHRLTLAGRMGARPIFRLKVIGDAKVDDVVAALAAEPGVLIAEPNQLHASPEATKNYVWAIGSVTSFVAQWAPQAMRLPQAWQLSTGTGVRVAVLDSGVDRSHPWLASRLLPGWDFIDNDADPSEMGTRADVNFGHGTHVAGLVALAAPGALIMPLRVLDAQGKGHAWSLAAAMLHAVDPDNDPTTDDGAQVINLSLAGMSRTRLLDTVTLLAACIAPDPAIAADDLSDAGYNADKSRCSTFAGTLVVAAVGNDASDKIRTYPAAEGAYGLISVASSSSNGRLSGFTNRGKWVHLAAPGDGLTSSVPGGWGTWSGTSMAAPMVAGAAALLRSYAPRLTATDSVRCLTRTTRELSGSWLGQVDALSMLRAVGDRSLCR